MLEYVPTYYGYNINTTIKVKLVKFNDVHVTIRSIILFMNQFL